MRVRLQYVSEADHVVVLRDGEVAESGKYKTLMAQGGALASMMQDVQDDEDPEKAPAAGAASQIQCRLALAESVQSTWRRAGVRRTWTIAVGSNISNTRPAACRHV